MMSTNLCSLRRKKSVLSEVKIALVGDRSVGKSALTVRYVTKRFIGEYSHSSEQSEKQRLPQTELPDTVRRETQIDNECVTIELFDPAPQDDGEDVMCLLSRVVSWCDALLLVYSITDRASFVYVKQLHRALLQLKQDGGRGQQVQVLLVANKSDMTHLRQVMTDEGEILAGNMECSGAFRELSAAEQTIEVTDAIIELSRAVLTARRATKHSLIDRVFAGRSNLRTYTRGKSDSALPKS